MKNYGNITSTYLASKGLRQCWLSNQLGERKLHLLTDKQIDALRQKGTAVYGSREGSQ